MSEMTTQEMLAVLRNCGDEGHTVSDEQADAIAARLKALEEAWRAAFKYLPREIQEDITGSLFPSDYRGRVFERPGGHACSGRHPRHGAGGVMSVYVCPQRDAVCPDNPQHWCAECPRHTEPEIVQSLRAQLAEYRAAITALDCWMEKHDPKARSDYWRWRHRYHAIVNDARGGHD